MPKPTSAATPDGAEPQRRKPPRDAELKRRSTPLPAPFPYGSLVLGVLLTANPGYIPAVGRITLFSA